MKAISGKDWANEMITQTKSSAYDKKNNVSQISRKKRMRFCL